ncbi:MAG TPA: carboxypeptidase regulatory-like domain-containing protein [Gemmatimonadaceae bacterium]|nr:carboxypeptidase regulatory-like domain-containing protein [Gemmatimonadaceae bacterium]
MRTPMRGFVLLAVLLVAASAGVGAQAAPNSGLSGIVIDLLDEPVRFAVITRGDENAGTTADEDGRFHLTGLRPGRTLFRVRRVGFEPVYFEVTLPEASNVEVRIRMHQTARVIPTVEVSDIREPLRRVGFYERMAAGSGHFITPEYLERIRPLRASDVLSNIPNVVVDRRGNRSRIMTSNYKCEYGLVVDAVIVGEPGSRVRTTSPDDVVSANDLYAVEVYPRNRGLPAKFLGMSHEDGCGTVVIWTKGMIAR